MVRTSSGLTDDDALQRKKGCEACCTRGSREGWAREKIWLSAGTRVIFITEVGGGGKL